MACCGRAVSDAASRVPPRAHQPSKRLFEYQGTGPLTIYGRATGIRYHFSGPGARVWVDARDAPVLEVVRGLDAVATN